MEFLLLEPNVLCEEDLTSVRFASFEHFDIEVGVPKDSRGLFKQCDGDHGLAIGTLLDVTILSE
jgi:hypothetical protein